MSAPTDAPPPYPDGEKADAPPYTEDTAYPPLLQQGYPQMGQPQLQQPAPGYPAQQLAPGYPAQQPPPGYPGSYQQQYWQPQQQTAHQGGYPVSAQPMAGASTVHILQTHYRDMPVQTQCPNCHNNVTTQVTFEPGAMSWLMCFIMFLVGLWLCCCIPFCVNGLQDADHHCPTCRHRIAHYSPM